MFKLIKHIKGTRKSGYLLICVFSLLPLLYTVSNIINDSFEIRTFAGVLVMAFSGGVGISLIAMGGDYYLTEKLKTKLAEMELDKIGDGTLQFIDEYTDWRRIEIEETFENRSVWIDHRFEKGWLGQLTYLDVYIEPLENAITTIKVSKNLNSEQITKGIRDSLGALQRKHS